MISPEPWDYLLFGAKVCSKCGQSLPNCTDFFPPDGRPGGVRNYCRQCRSAQDRERYAADPALRAAKARYKKRRAVR